MEPLPPDTLLHRLDLALRQRIEGYAQGQTSAFGIRGGIELERIRPWTPGDDWRQLDAAATARTGEPHVRVPVAERRLTLWVAVDVTSSMAFGTRTGEKADLARFAASVFGLIALRQAGKVGAIALGVPDARPSRPQAGRPALLGVLRDLTAARESAAGSLADGLALLERVANQRHVVVVVSDFRDPDVAAWQRPLARLALRRDVICVEVSDPREFELPDVGVARFRDPESGRTFTVDTSSRTVREKFAGRAAARRSAAELAINEAGADLMRVSTGDDWVEVMIRNIQNRRRQRWASATRSG